SREGELTVNLQKTKNLTNVRAAGSDRNLKIAPHIELSLEQALEYIEDDELVELTPKSIRLRKIRLTALDRKRNKNN
ncbi:MAG: translational GTPase TypA, partial [Victivallales bacterium]|nr:translational GTPase TypA [Victivallales bacterium]